MKLNLLFIVFIVFFCSSFLSVRRFLFCLMLLARTGILTVALLAGDIGQSGLVPGQEKVNHVMKS